MDYYKKIDGLRFLAIFCVLIQHFAWEVGKLTNAGWFGVDLFFVISGFLITSILIRINEGSIKLNYLKFIGRRTLRIFPIYYIAVLILWFLGVSTIRENLVYFLTYTFNYAWVKYNIPQSIVHHFWSLSLEEQFYVFWPFIVLSLRSRYKILLIVIAAIIILGFAQTFFQIIPALTPYNDVGLLTRMSSLGIGSFGAVLLTMNALPLKLFQNKFIEYFIVVLLIISLAINQPAFKLIILPFCSFYLVLKAAKFDFTIKPLRNFFGNKWIIYIGRLSYGIYIFHVPIDYYFTIYIFNVFWSLINFDTLGNFSFFKNYIWFFKFPFSVLLSVLFAALSFKYIESPILKLKDKFFKY